MAATAAAQPFLSLERKLRKNAFCLNQSAKSSFALYVITNLIRSWKTPVGNLIVK